MKAVLFKSRLENSIRDERNQYHKLLHSISDEAFRLERKASLLKGLLDGFSLGAKNYLHQGLGVCFLVLVVVEMEMNEWNVVVISVKVGNVEVNSDLFRCKGKTSK